MNFASVGALPLKSFSTGSHGMKNTGLNAPVDDIALSRSKEGQAISHSSYDEARAEKDFKASRQILRGGFELIKTSPATTECEKALASYGIDVGDDKMVPEEAVKARCAVMKTIMDSSAIPVAATLAQASYGAAKALSKWIWIHSWDSENKVLKEGFTAIAANLQATETEKTLAALGVNVDNDKMLSKYTARARYTVMAALNGTLAGPLGSTIAAVAGQAAKSLTGGVEKIVARFTRDKERLQDIWKNEGSVLKEGFELIGSSSQAGEIEKTLARYGLDVGDDDMLQEGAAKARYAVMEAITENPCGPVGSVLARTACATAQSVISLEGKTVWSCARKVLLEGFEELAQNSRVGDESKKLARQGIYTGRAQMSHKAAVAEMHQLMEKIDDTSMEREKQMREEMIDMAEKAANEDSTENIAVEDEYIIIDGVRLRRRKKTENSAKTTRSISIFSPLRRLLEKLKPG